MRKHISVYVSILLISAISYGYAGWDDPVLHSGGDVTLTGTTTIDGPMVQNETLNAATGNEVAYQLNYTTDKASSGNDTGLEISMTDTTSPGTSLPLDIKVGGSSVFSVGNTGGVTSANGVISMARFTTSYGASGSNPAYAHTGTQSTWGSIFKDSGTVGVMNGSDTLNIFDAAITNSNHTGTGNSVNAFNAGNITGDAEAVESAIKIGTGWDYDFSSTATAQKGFTKTPLTNNSATDLFTITLAAGESVSGRLEYGLTVTGGTSDIQEHSGCLFFACANKGGTFTKDIKEDYNNSSDTYVETDVGSTLADTWAMKAGNVCTVTLNMNSNLSSAVNTVSGRIVLMSVKPLTLN